VGEMKNTRDTFLLLLLMYFGKKVHGRTRFQKTVCVLKYKYKIPFHFKFRSYYYGPYSDDLADALSLLQGLNLITEEVEDLGEGMVRYTYKLTDKGVKIVNSLISKTGDKKIVSRMGKYFAEIQRMPISELIALSKKIDLS
jgi:uncharacterized protein YwgA